MDLCGRVGKRGLLRGRKRVEAAPVAREFQRDRDRMFIWTAFRRLEYKTQVFVNHEGESDSAPA